MARSINFNGMTLFRPGGLTRVRVSPLSPIGPTATGILGLIGEADGGEPGTVITIDDPALATDTFTSGPLADAIRQAFDPSNDGKIPSGVFRVYAYKTNASTQSSSFMPGPTANALISDTTQAGSTTTVINATTTLVADAHIGRWLTTAGELRRIVDNTTSTITVSPGFSTAPATSAAIKILSNPFTVTSRDYGEATTQIAVEIEPGVTSDTYIATVSKGTTVEQSPELGGKAFLEIKYVGGPTPLLGVTTDYAVDLEVTAATTSTVSLDVGGSTPTLNQYANMLVQFSDGKQRKITGNTAADPTVLTLDASSLLTAAEAAAAVGQTATIRNVTSATATIAGSSGVATGLTTTVAPTADDLSITFTSTMTLRQLVEQLNGTTNYEATIPAGVNPDTTLMSSFDFGTRATAVDVRFDNTISYSSKGTFRRDLQVMVDWFNEFSELTYAERGDGASKDGSELPQVTGGVSTTTRDFYITLIGGSRGISSNSDFQAGFDALIEKRLNHCVPLISEDLTNEGYGSTATFASVAAQANEFASLCAGIGRNENGVYLGMSGTRTELITQAANLNNADVQLFGQKMTVLNAAGTLTELPEWIMAVTAAGMRSGAEEVGTPLTFKSIKCNGISQDSSWSPRSITDQNALIQGGVMFAEQTPQGTYRFVRDMTTWLNDDNICFVDGNMREEIRFVAYDFRKQIEDKFTGDKATAATVANIREYAASLLVSYKAQNILVDSLDPETGTTVIPGWRRLRVFSNGNIVTIRVQIFPAAQVLWELSDISVQVPSLAL